MREKLKLVLNREQVAVTQVQQQPILTPSELLLSSILRDSTYLSNVTWRIHQDTINGRLGDLNSDTISSGYAKIKLICQRQDLR